jgi:hypothetical protein
MLRLNVPYSLLEWSFSTYSRFQFSTNDYLKIRRSSRSFYRFYCCVRYISTLCIRIRILSFSSSKIIDTSFLSLVMLLYTGIPFCSCIISLVIYSTIFYSVLSVGFELPDRPLGVSAVSSRLLRRL